MSVRVAQDTGGRGLMALERRLRELARQQVFVGVPKGAKPEADGTPMALVAAATEFGHTSIHPDQPERPFLREGIRHALPKLRRTSAAAAKAVCADAIPVSAALDIIGLEAVGEVKLYMAGPHFEPNAPSTIAAKKSEQPTIGKSGALRQSITHVVGVTP